MNMETRQKLKKSNSGTVGTDIRLLQRLCTAMGVSADEREVRKIVLEEIKSRPCTPEMGERTIDVDALGNVLVSYKPRHAERLQVMLAAHMDEVGMIVTQEDNGGFYRFEVVGGIDKRQLVGKAVIIGPDHIPGVIGAKPIHLTTEDERKNAIAVDDLRIDVSPANKGKVKVGDRAVFASHFKRNGPSLMAKAFDDRIGIAILLELCGISFPKLDLSLAFTTQEELGLRGAGRAAYALKPDIAIVVDCSPAYDLPHWDVDRGKPEENTRYNTHLGEGPAIYIADRHTISDPRLVRFFTQTAEQQHIPFQLRQPGGGGTDAGSIHLQLEGIPTISVSVPGRYIHTFSSIIRLADWQSTLVLLKAVLERLDKNILGSDFPPQNEQ